MRRLLPLGISLFAFITLTVSFQTNDPFLMAFQTILWSVIAFVAYYAIKTYYEIFDYENAKPIVRKLERLQRDRDQGW